MFFGLISLKTLTDYVSFLFKELHPHFSCFLFKVKAIDVSLGIKKRNIKYYFSALSISCKFCKKNQLVFEI